MSTSAALSRRLRQGSRGVYMMKELRGFVEELAIPFLFACRKAHRAYWPSREESPLRALLLPCCVVHFMVFALLPFTFFWPPHVLPERHSGRGDGCMSGPTWKEGLPGNTLHRWRSRMISGEVKEN